MRRRDAEAEAVVVGNKKLVAMAEDLTSASREEEWLPLLLASWRQGLQPTILESAAKMKLGKVEREKRPANMKSNIHLQM
jgi:hypothetical protein